MKKIMTYVVGVALLSSTALAQSTGAGSAGTGSGTGSTGAGTGRTSTGTPILGNSDDGMPGHNGSANASPVPSATPGNAGGKGSGTSTSGTSSDSSNSGLHNGNDMKPSTGGVNPSSGIR